MTTLRYNPRPDQAVGPDGGDCVVLTDGAPPLALPHAMSIGQAEREFLENSPDGGTLDRRAIGWLKSWADAPAYRGRSVKRLMASGDASLWWFCESMMFRESVREEQSLRSVILRIDALMHIIDTRGIERVSVEDAGSFTGKCLVAIASAKGIPFTAEGTTHRSGGEGFALAVHCAKSARSLLRQIMAKTLGRRYAPKARPKVLLLSYFHSLREDRRTSGVGELRDVHMGGVAEALDAKGVRTRTLIADVGYPLGLKSLATLKSPRAPTDLYGSALDAGHLARTRRLRDLWRKVSRSRELRASMTYRGVGLYPLLRGHLAFFFLKQCPEADACIATMSRALARERPACVVMHNETGFNGRAMLVAARRRGVPAVGVCHGSMTDKEVEYYHQGEGPELPCPIPDVTTVFGERDRQLLLSFGAYTGRGVVVTGSPQHDRLANPEARYSRDALANRLGAARRKLVAVTTQPFHHAEEREPWLRAVLGAAKGIEDAFFIVKPHPSESTEMHERVVRELGCSNAVVSKDVDTHELMFSSALTVTAWSTTGLESMMLGTPLMTVNLTGREEIIDYASSGAAIGVDRAEDIAPNLRRALDGDFPEGMLERMKEYVLDRAYLMDGGAARRVAAIAERLAKSRGGK